MIPYFRDLAVYFLHSAEDNDNLRSRFPEMPNRWSIKQLQKTKLNQFIRKRIARKHYGSRMHLYNKVINFFRIDWLLVPPEPLTDKFREAVDLLLEKHTPDELGDYLEFGVYQGTSLACMHQVLQEKRIPSTRLFGFDSFEGLPKGEEGTDDAKRWQEGAYASDLKFTKANLTKKGIDWTRTFLIKGYFSDSLNNQLIQKYQIKQASFIMFDCDMYKSTAEALRFCEPLIGDQVIFFFDDWNCTDETAGQKKAFAEFKERNPDLVATEMGTYYRNSTIFILNRTKNA